MFEKRIYIDTEPYHLPILQLWSKGEKYLKTKNFYYEYENWVFNPSVEIDNKKVEQRGIIGMLIIESNVDDKTRIRNVIRRQFVQLVGEYATKDNFLKDIDGMTDVLCYHGRLKPDWRGYTGFDYGIIKYNFGVSLEDLPNVKSEDLELICHRSGLYGGQKVVEKQLGFLGRESGVDSHDIVNHIMYQLLSLELKNDRDEYIKKLKSKLMRLHLLYNKDDIRGMLYIDQKLNNIRFAQNANSKILNDDVKCRLLEENPYDDDDNIKRCNNCGYFYLESNNSCQACDEVFWSEEE